ncbi:hypothetical protein MMPV_007961 [Pyropia vietnamensis]
MKVSAASAMVLGVATSLMAVTTTLMATTSASAASVTGVERWTPSVKSGLQLPELTARDISFKYNGRRFRLNDDASCEEVGEALEQVMRDKDLARNIVWQTLEGWKEDLLRDWEAYQKGKECAKSLIESLCGYLDDFTVDEIVAKRLKEAANEHGAFDTGGTKPCASAQRKCCTSWKEGGSCMSRCRSCARTCNRELKVQPDSRYIIEDFNEGRWCFARLMDAHGGDDVGGGQAAAATWTSGGILSTLPPQSVEALVPPARRVSAISLSANGAYGTARASPPTTASRSSAAGTADPAAAAAAAAGSNPPRSWARRPGAEAAAVTSIGHRALAWKAAGRCTARKPPTATTAAVAAAAAAVAPADRVAGTPSTGCAPAGARKRKSRPDAAIAAAAVAATAAADTAAAAVVTDAAAAANTAGGHGGSGGEAKSSGDESDESPAARAARKRREQQRLRNKESAKEYRQRRRKYNELMEEKAAALEWENGALGKQLACLDATARALEAQLDLANDLAAAAAVGVDGRGGGGGYGLGGGSGDDDLDAQVAWALRGSLKGALAYAPHG